MGPNENSLGTDRIAARRHAQLASIMA